MALPDLPAEGSLDLAAPAFIGGDQLSFGDAFANAKAIASALSAAGLRVGDRAAIATASNSSFYACFAACWSSGYPVAVIDAAAGAGELCRILARAAPAALIADSGTLERLAGSEVLGHSDRIWQIRDSATNGDQSTSVSDHGRKNAADYPAIHALTAPVSTEPALSLPGTLPAYVMFTSGTTSLPKAVVVSRDALRHHVATLVKVFGYDKRARLLHFLPLHHTDGLVHGVAASLFTGMTVVNPGKFSQAVDLEGTLAAYDISHFLVVPTMLAMIRHDYDRSPDLFRFECFRHLISTAGYLDLDFWDEFQSFYSVRVSNFYGMTETVSGSLYCGPDEANYRIGSVGRPVDCQARIVDENGTILGDDRVGELQISGSHLMDGYLDDPESTQSVLTDGWLSTGDLFSRDRDGFFRIVGRKKNIIKRGGVTIYPEDIRRIIAGMPGVLEVEVVGLPDPAFGELIAVGAVAENGVDAETIRALCRRELAPEKYPDRVTMLATLPRGPSGKVQVEALITELAKRHSPTPVPEVSARERVFAIAAEVFAIDPGELNDASSPETVANWDSYAGMEFVLALERGFALRLGTRDIMSIRDIGTAVRVVLKNSSATDGKRD